MAQQPVMENPSEQSQDNAQGGAPQGGGPFEQLVTSVSTNLSKIQQLLSQEGVPDALTSKLGDLNDQYQAVLQEIMQSLGSESSKGPVKPGGAGSGMVDAQGGIHGVPV
jgi:hypothetical protein